MSTKIIIIMGKSFVEETISSSIVVSRRTFVFNAQESWIIISAATTAAHTAAVSQSAAITAAHITATTQSTTTIPFSIAQFATTPAVTSTSIEQSPSAAVATQSSTVQPFAGVADQEFVAKFTDVFVGVRTFVILSLFGISGYDQCQCWVSSQPRVRWYFQR